MTQNIPDGRNIIWIASYPKSGSTWLRCLLTASLFPEEPLDINRLIGGSHQLGRQALDDYCAIDSAHMRFDELVPYRAALHRYLAEEAGEAMFLKTHNCFVPPKDGGGLFPQEASRGALYVVRDPVDIIPSLAHHEGRDLVWTVARLGDREATLNQWTDKTSTSLPEWMDSWSGHVASWLDQTSIPICLVRYEDLHDKSHATLARVLEFCGIAHSPATIDAAIRSCAITQLKDKEARSPFREAVSSARPFFRSGTIGDGHKTFGTHELQAFRRTHGSQMHRLGYGPHPAATTATD